MSGNTTFMAKKNNIERKWYVVDATDKPLGRLASQVAKILQGKHKPVYTPHVDTGDFVIVLNADKVKLTGRKAQQSMVYRYSG
ncbi:MAG TPA: 50S ribosomal protein L13, partial [Synergistaceae bacterium]|nr:50S ribosomal protein L13 [Synergistaceae bacterium]